MPKIYEYFGLMFFIHTRGEMGHIVHVHVEKGKKESIIEILRNKRGVSTVRQRKVPKSKSTTAQLSAKDLAIAMKFVNIKAEEIVQAWDLIMSGKYEGNTVRVTRRIV